LATAAKPVYDSASYRVSAISELKELGKYRYLLGQLIRRDILTRYKRSVLGVAWTMLNPLGTMLILTFVFSNFFKSAVPHYPVYILSGLLVWNFFSQGTNAAISGLVWGGSLLKRIYIPSTVFGVSAIGTALVNLILSLVPLLLVMLIDKAPFFESLWALHLFIGCLFSRCSRDVPGLVNRLDVPDAYNLSRESDFSQVYAHLQNKPHVLDGKNVSPANF